MSLSDISAMGTRLQAEIFRRMSGEQRMWIVFQLSDALRNTTMATIRKENPELADWQVKLEWFRFVFAPEPLPNGLAKALRTGQ